MRDCPSPRTAKRRWVVTEKAVGVRASNDRALAMDISSAIKRMGARKGEVNHVRGFFGVALAPMLGEDDLP